jgi:chemotaxis protein histidine kinase CheA
MTVSSTTTKNSYSGDGSTTTFAYAFKIFADADLTVILRSAAGTETVQTLTTHYTVTNAGNASGGNVVFGSAPASGVTVVIRRNMAQTQSTDYTANDPFPAESHEDALDRLTFIAQQQQEELDRSIKLSRTNTMTSTEFTVGATDRANKILAFDGSGEISVTQELGTYRGTDATVTTEAYVVRDIIKSTTTAQLNNVYICVADAVVGDSLTDTDHFELLVDAVSAASSATAAAASATTATTKASEAATSATNAATSETNAATSASTATTKASEASTSATNAAASATTASTKASEASTSATNAATSASAAATSATNAATSETNAATSATNATTKASEASTSATNAATSATAAQTAQTAAEAAQTAAETAADNFDDTYLGAKSSDPSVDNDGDALNAGDLYFNTTSNVLKVYNGSAWQDAAVDATTLATKGFATAMAIAL